jgi:hypothetical protein
MLMRAHADDDALSHGTLAILAQILLGSAGLQVRKYSAIGGARVDLPRRKFVLNQ